MKLPALILSTLLASASVSLPAFALDVPAPSSSDSRVRSVSYNEWDVVRVVGTLRTTVQVVFGQDEEITDVAGGDTVSWEIRPRGHILYLKAREQNPPSNLQVATIRADGTTRTYSFELVVRDGSIENNSRDVYFQVRFSYPRDEANSRRAAQAEERARAQEQAALARLSESAATTGTRNWRYLVAGSTAIEPTEAYDNGEMTVLTFSRTSRMPSVYVVNPDGTERLVNASHRRNQLIIHDVAPEIRLRLGSEVTAIYNMGVGSARGYTGTGTTSNSVRREIIGGSNG